MANMRGIKAKIATEPELVPDYGPQDARTSGRNRDRRTLPPYRVQRLSCDKQY